MPSLLTRLRAGPAVFERHVKGTFDIATRFDCHHIAERRHPALDEETDPFERACADAVYQAEFTALLGGRSSASPEARTTR